MVIWFEPGIFQYASLGWGDGYASGAGYSGHHYSPNSCGRGYTLGAMDFTTSGLGYAAALFKVST